MSAKSPPLFTLNGANSAMSSGPDHSSRCFSSSQLRSPAPRVRDERPRPLSLYPFEPQLESPFLSAASTSGTSGVHVPGPTASRCRRRSLPGSPLRTCRIRTDDPRRAWRAASPSGSTDGPFGHCPREQHAIVLEAEVVVQMAREVLLHAEEQRARRAPRRGDRPLVRANERSSASSDNPRGPSVVLSALRPSV